MVKIWMKRGLVVLAVLVGLGVLYEAVGVGTQAVTLGSRAEERFTGTDLSGKTWSLEKHLGQRPVLVTFFSVF